MIIFWLKFKINKYIPLVLTTCLENIVFGFEFWAVGWSCCGKVNHSLGVFSQLALWVRNILLICGNMTSQ